MPKVCECGRPVPAQPSRGRARKFCEVCSPSRSRVRAAAAAAGTTPPRIRTDVQAAVRELDLDGDPGARILGAAAERLAEDVDAAETVRDRVAALTALLRVADRLDLVAPTPGAAGPMPWPPAPPSDDPDGEFEVPDTFPQAPGFTA